MIGTSMMGDLSPGASMLELDPAPAETIQPGANGITDPTLLKVAQELGYDPNSQDAGSWIDSLSTTVQPGAKPSMRDRWAARRATRGSANPINPVMDWLSGTDWSQARGRDERPILANLGSKLKDPGTWLNALSFVNPQIAMLNRAINMGQAFKKGPKEAGLGLLGALIGNRFGARGQNIFNTARGIRGGDTFKQGLGNLFTGELLGRMGKNRDVGQGILSMMGGKDPGRAFSDFAIGRAGGKMNPMQQQLFRAGIQTKRGRPMGEAFGSAFKGMARRQGMQQLFQRAFQKGGMPAVQKLRAVMSLGGGPG
jgi:hypothetical protein